MLSTAVREDTGQTFPATALDQIWDAAETAERTSLTVLSALMLRARRQPAGTQAEP